MNTRSIVFTLALVALAGCAEPDFPVYNELDGFRVLTVRATPPDLVPGDSVALDALIYDAGEAVTLRWSLCPWPSNPNDGYACVVDQALWDAAWSAAGLSDAPALGLGQAESAALAIPDDLPGLRGVCLELLERLGASVTLPPDCEGVWNWTVRLTASAGGETIDAIKDVPVLLAVAPERNANPVVDQLTIGEVGGERVAEGVALPHNRKVWLTLDIDADQAERYTPPLALGQPTSELKVRPEALTFTWFVEGGETDRIRTTFREGVESLSKASKNRWRTPRTGKGAALFVVVRDNRGGVDFVRGNALFSD